MKVFKLGQIEEEALIRECLVTLSVKGSVLLVPTETVYGLVCRASDKEAAKKIYELKKRSENKPLALFVHDTEMLKKTDALLLPAAEKLASRLCPGPLTIIVPDKSGNSKTGFRIPDHGFILELLRKLGEPLASTSANLSGKPPALTVAEALADFDGEPELAVDNGPLPENAIASTVVDFCADGFRILREGPVSEKTVRDILG